MCFSKDAADKEARRAAREARQRSRQKAGKKPNAEESAGKADSPKGQGLGRSSRWVIMGGLSGAAIFMGWTLSPFAEVCCLAWSSIVRRKASLVALSFFIPKDTAIGKAVQGSYAWRQLKLNLQHAFEPLLGPNKDILPTWPWHPSTPPNMPCPPLLVALPRTPHARLPRCLQLYRVVSCRGGCFLEAVRVSRL